MGGELDGWDEVARSNKISQGKAVLISFCDTKARFVRTCMLMTV